MQMKKFDFSRKVIADAICARLDAAALAAARDAYAASGPIQHFVIDNLLPEAMAKAIHASFPAAAQMFERRNLREHKYVAAQMDRYERQAEEALYGFQDPRVVELVSSITELPELLADPQLYAGGLSLMAAGNFLNPHVDNSHNNDRSTYRVLNLLYYVSPGWELQDGGHLELWPGGVRQPPETIPSLFNRLVVMSTGPASWHSVCAVKTDSPRCCVSNYYFSPRPIGGTDYFRVTSFRGRPGQPFRDALLQIDSTLRGAIRMVRPRGISATKHIYRPQRTDGK
jgi:Rps23 Pro-64 3,4-dihydroxylase Tpa1-like proline 4-hydroxylase